MKLVCCLLAVMTVITGCSSENKLISEALQFRETLLSSNGCGFSAEITADYGDSVTRFSMACQSDASGKTLFEITQPQSIAGIKGIISDQGGSIEFEDKALYFPLLTDELLTPASAPWILLRTLRSGYITSACMEESLLHVTVNDDYEDDALMLDIWLEGECPVRADILHDGKRILSVQVENFVLL